MTPVWFLKKYPDSRQILTDGSEVLPYASTLGMQIAIETLTESPTAAGLVLAAFSSIEERGQTEP